jgi:hypothetical protein
MVRHRHGDCGVLDSLLHHNVTAASSNLNESMARQNGANFTAGETRSLPNLNL